MVFLSVKFPCYIEYLCKLFFKIRSISWDIIFISKREPKTIIRKKIKIIDLIILIPLNFYVENGQNQNLSLK